MSGDWGGAEAAMPKAVWLTGDEVKAKYGVTITQSNLDPRARFYVRSKLAMPPHFTGRLFLQDDVEFMAASLKKEKR